MPAPGHERRLGGAGQDVAEHGGLAQALHGHAAGQRRQGDDGQTGQVVGGVVHGPQVQQQPRVSASLNAGAGFGARDFVGGASKQRQLLAVRSWFFELAGVEVPLVAG